MGHKFQTTDMDSIQTFRHKPHTLNAVQLRVLSSGISDECWSMYRSVSREQSCRNVMSSFSTITHNGRGYEAWRIRIYELYTNKKL